MAKRPGSKKIYDTRVANRLIADILVVSDRFAANNPQTRCIKFAQGWLRRRASSSSKQPSRAHTLIGTIKDFNVPADLAKTMLEGVHLSDYADNKAFFGTAGSDSDYANIFKTSQEMYRELRLIKRVADTESSVDRRYVAQLAGKFTDSPAEAPLAYKEPPKGATPIATQRKTIFFEPNSAKMGLDSRAVVDEIGDFMRAYENTAVDIEGNTDSSGARELNMSLSKDRAESVKGYLVQKYRFPPNRMRTVGNGPDRPLEDNGTTEGREKNRRTDIKVYPNPASKQ